MSTIVVEYLRVTYGLSLLGLFLVMMGALVVLAPELPYFARVITMYDRWKLKRMVKQMERGKVLDNSTYGFKFLQAAVVKSMDEEDTERPVEVNEGGPLDLRHNFDEIYINDDDVVHFSFSDEEIKNTLHKESLLDGIDNFTGLRKEYFKLGGFLLAVGFSLQFLTQLAQQFPILSMSLLAIEAVVLIGVSFWLFY